ncbi:TPA: phage tail tape measure protein, partial [Streptococcus suis]|nr:phage tail tape measure protein [Streptococcus suis]
KAMNGQLDELNDQQLKKALDVSKKWIEEENKSYKERKNNLKEMYDSIKGSDEEAVRARSEIQAKLNQLEADHLAKMDAYGQRYAEIRKKLAEKVTFGNEQAETTYWNTIEKEMEELGLSYDELMVKSTQASSKI